MNWRTRGMVGDERIQALEERVEMLERRLRWLERPAPPRPAAIAGPAAPVGPAAPSTRRPRLPSLPRPTLPSGPAPDLEQLFGGRVLAWLGGAAIFAGLAFLLALAITSGWLGETARALLAGAASLALVATGVALHERGGRTE